MLRIHLFAVASAAAVAAILGLLSFHYRSKLPSYDEYGPGFFRRMTEGDAAPLALIFPNDGCAIPVYEKDWSGLDDAQQEAAKALEYDEEMWNNDQDPIWMDDTEWTHLSAEAQMNVMYLGILNEGAWEDFYEDYFFWGLPPAAQDAVQTLGPGKRSWDAKNDFVALDWTDLTRAMKDAAETLGYGCYSWDKAQPSSWHRNLGDGIGPSSMPSDPTRAPTLAPTPLPSGVSTSSSVPSQAPSCFSGDNQVDILGKGLVSIDQIELGDDVLTDTGYSKVYAFGRRDREEPMTFLKITLETGEHLELSPGHFVLLGSAMGAYAADEVEVGEELMLMPSRKLSKISSIKEVVKNGSYHPLTYDGSIVANGILASVYDADPYYVNIQMFGTDILDFHDVKHISYSPLRLMCKLAPESLCGHRNHYGDDGSHHMVQVMVAIENLIMPNAVESEPYNLLNISAGLPIRLIFFVSLIFVHALENLLTIIIWCLLFLVTRAAKEKISFKISGKKNVKQKHA